MNGRMRKGAPLLFIRQGMGILGLTSPQRSPRVLRVHGAAVANLLSFSEPCSPFLQKWSGGLDLEGPFGVSRAGLANPDQIVPPLRPSSVTEWGRGLPWPSRARWQRPRHSAQAAPRPAAPRAPPPVRSARAPRVPGHCPGRVAGHGARGNGCAARVVAHRARRAS